jgi:tetratricopeptide (TPR) repeat protein
VGAGYLVAARSGPDPLAQGGAAMPGPVVAQVREYRARLEANPRDLDALLGMARLNLQRNDLAQAIEFDKRALDVDPGNPEALSRFGMILADAGHLSDALRALDQALARDPNRIEALWWKGQVELYGLKDYRAAVATWERLATLVPPGAERERAAAALAEARVAAAAGPEASVGPGVAAPARSAERRQSGPAPGGAPPPR